MSSKIDQGASAPLVPPVEWMHPDDCVRLYDSQGTHILTMLRCSLDDEAYDLATPNGIIIYHIAGSDELCEHLRTKGATTKLVDKVPQL